MESNPQDDFKNRTRVHIKYEADVNGAIKEVELPFVVGVLANLSGNVRDHLPELTDRNMRDFVNSKEDFDRQLEAIAPHLRFTVPNTLTGKDNMDVDLTFRSLDDFRPEAIARKVEPLRKLLEKRVLLKELNAKLGVKQKAQDSLKALLKDDDMLRALLAKDSNS